MAEKESLRGSCSYCGGEFERSGALRHIKNCARRKEAVAGEESRGGEAEDLFHLRIQAADLPPFWLDIEMSGAATLRDLDKYLKAIWLECCGHMSQFSVGGWSGSKMPMSRRADQVFQKGVKLTHIYDFGTESVTLVQVQGVRQGKPTTDHPIALMVRNLRPQCACIACGDGAEWLCMECLIEDDLWGTLCNKHRKTHPHKDYGGTVPLLNSPRVGLCGYTGPAEPPY